MSSGLLEPFWGQLFHIEMCRNLNPDLNVYNNNVLSPGEHKARQNMYINKEI